MAHTGSTASCEGPWSLRTVAQLKDLCLTSIEQTGADTLEVLSEIRDVLPARMWSRHPTLKITGTSLLDAADEGVFEQSIEIMVEYTGVYRIKVKCNLKQAPGIGDFLSRHTEYLPRESEETYENLDGTLEKRIRELMRDRFCKIVLMNSVEDKPIVEIAEYDPYLADSPAFAEDMKRVPQKIRSVLESLPQYIHV